MSWDNVFGISEFNIWAESNTTSQGDDAYLYVNNHHQVKITVGLSLALIDSSSPGPSDDEVRKGLALINNNDGGELKHLIIGEKGNYTGIYDPNHVTVNFGAMDSDYQYEIDFYLSSNNTVNSDIASEEVSVKLSYTDVDGATQIEDMSEQGAYNEKDFIKVTCYAQRKYTTSDFSLSKNEINDTWHSSYSSDDYPTYILRLRISGGYYLMHSMSMQNESQSENNSHNDHCIGWYTSKTSAVMWDECSNCYAMTLIGGMGKKTYSHDLYAYYYGEPGVYGGITCGYHSVTVDQNDNEFIFISTKVSAKGSLVSDPYLENHYFDVYDQFGNYCVVTMAVEESGNQVFPRISSVG